MGSAVSLGDRRHDPRRRVVADHGVVAVRVRPGIQARLIDVSVRGAQIETAHRLSPGRVVHVQLVFPSCVTALRGRVTRSHVAEVTAERVGYRCGVRFDRALRWIVEENGVRYVVVE